MITLKYWSWRLAQLVAAAVLLAIDPRWFALYAFAHLLGLLYRLDKLWALMRLVGMRSDISFILMLRRAGVTEAEATGLTGQLYHDFSQTVQRDLDRDAALLGGDSCSPPKTYL